MAINSPTNASDDTSILPSGGIPNTQGPEIDNQTQTVFAFNNLGIDVCGVACGLFAGRAKIYGDGTGGGFDVEWIQLRGQHGGRARVSDQSERILFLYLSDALKQHRKDAAMSQLSNVRYMDEWAMWFKNKKHFTKNEIEAEQMRALNSKWGWDGNNPI